MRCKICKDDASAPKAIVPGKYVWCSPECWSKEKILVEERVRARLPLQWDPRHIMIFR